MDNNNENDETAPLPLAKEEAPADNVVNAYLRGTASLDSDVVVIRGHWAFSKNDFDTKDSNKVSPFEFTYLGDMTSISSNSSHNGSDSYIPPSGPYKGYVCLKVEGRPHLRIAEHDLELSISQQDGVSGTGYNKYGRFKLKGGLLENSQLEFYKSYTGEPAPEKPKKRAKEVKKSDTANSLKRARQQLAIATPTPLTIEPTKSDIPVAEEPCMRGEMETSAEGLVQIKGRWAIRASDFENLPKSTSPFDYTLNNKDLSNSSVPLSGHYSGGFHMKMQGRSKRVKESDIVFQFIPNYSKEEEEGQQSNNLFDLKASGSNEFGIFTMRGTARPSMTSTNPNVYSIEIFRTYTSYHPPPVVPKTGRGWAIEPPTLGTPSSGSSMSRQASVPASKEPRSGLTAPNSKKKKGGGESSSNVGAPIPSLTTSVSDSGRKRKAPNKLVDELNFRGNGDSSNTFDQPTKNKLEGLVRHLKSKETSVYFAEPVDPIRLGIPTYLDVIKHPMDLKTAERKLIGNMYADPQEFASDIRLIFSNSRLFNHVDPTSPVYLATVKLSDIFETKWKDFEVWYRNRLENEREKEIKASVKQPTTKTKSNGSSSGGGGGGKKRSSNTPATPGHDTDEFRFLQNKMLEMSQEILDLQRAATTQNIQIQLAAHTASNGKKGKGKITAQDVLGDTASEALLDNIPLTTEEKETVAKQVDKLPANKLNRVLEIVQEQMQLSGFHDQDDDIELDIDTMPNKTLRALQRYLKECFPPKKAPAKPRAPRPSKKKPAPLPVPSTYAPPPPPSIQQQQRDETTHQAKRSKPSAPPQPVLMAPPLMKSGDDTSDSEDESGGPAPWASSVPIDPAASRRLAGLDSDSDSDDEPPAPPAAKQQALSSSSSSSLSSLAPTQNDTVSSSQVRLVETTSTEEVKVVNAGAWAAASWDSVETTDLSRQRSDSYDDTTNNWSQLHSDIQEQQQVDEHRKMEEVKLLQQQQQQQQDAKLQAKRLQEVGRPSLYILEREKERLILFSLLLCF